jgi:alkylated DNA nucleotide flippase Atl1
LTCHDGRTVEKPDWQVEGAGLDAEGIVIDTTEKISLEGNGWQVESDEVED